MKFLTLGKLKGNPFKNHKEIAMARAVTARVVTSATTLESQLSYTTYTLEAKKLTEPFLDICCGVHICAMLVRLLVLVDIVYW